MTPTCTGTTKRGRPCPNQAGFFGLPLGPDSMCAAHTSDAELHGRYETRRNEGAVAKAASVSAPRAPQSLDDAAKLAAWAARKVAQGKLSKDDAAALRDLLREFRELLGARDADAKLAEARRVLEEMKTLKGAKS